MAQCTILLIDDNDDIVSLLKAFLESEGYVVYCARNGIEGIALQRTVKASIVITDLFMPESDGFEIIQLVQSEFPETEIIVLSGDARKAKGQYLQSAAMLGVAGTLSKPFEPRNS